MIKKGCLILALLCLLGLWGCTPQKNDGPISTTLMVYMIGSDLEAKAGAATEDLAEMAQSGIDLSRHKVVVCAGGSDYWHNDEPQTDDRRILELTENGFVQTGLFPAQSMGEADSLQAFLDHAAANYPSDRYALILWDHGNGPLEGYGKDVLYGNDALLLEEMKQAMDASCFGPENKLAFVGFDACLMASAELSCLWADYADYLVASQEVEPAFGWSYSFLGDLGNPDIPGLLTRVTSDYLSTCLAYYQEKGFENRDTTLSCVDLSKASALEQALEALFTRAGREDQYNALVSCRVQTRALGRSTTGSEYDLVDLADLALQLKSLYPQEAEALEAAVSDMVIANATNTTGCCGMSLYFPFYNKQYYQRRWQETYQKLDPFPAYQEYLTLYEKSWLDASVTSSFNYSFTPTAQDGRYTLAMTPEQADNYASARYYILRRESEQMYNYLFISSDITRTDNVLTANFDGKVLYVKDMYQTYHIPVAIELEKIGELAHYAVPFCVTARKESPDDLFGEITGLRYHLVLNTETGEISVCSLLPSDGAVDADQLMGGKLEEMELTDYLTAMFWEREHSYLTRDENGAILPLDQWHQNSWFTAIELYCADGLQFVYEPLAGGEYYLMMEVQDTRGNRFCSELLPIQIPDREMPAYEMPRTQITWDSGESVLLCSSEDLELYLTCVEVTGKLKYSLELRNNSDMTLSLSAYNLLCNDNIVCEPSDYIGSMTVPPGQQSWFSSFMDLGTAELAGDLQQLKNIQFDVLIRDANIGTSVLPWTQFTVELGAAQAEHLSSRQNRIAYNANAFYGVRAEEQLLVDNSQMKVTLLGLGATDTNDPSVPNYILRVENKTPEALTLAVSGIALNHVYDRGGPTLNLAGNHTGYLSGTIATYNFDDMGITQIESVELLLSIIEGDSIAGGFSRSTLYPITLAESGIQEAPFREGSTVIFDKEGVRIALDLSRYYYTYSSNPSFSMTVCNGSDRNILPKLRNATINGIPVSSEDFVRSLSLYGGDCCPGQYGYGYLNCNPGDEPAYEVSFTIQLMDIHEEAVVYTDTETITLRLDPEAKEGRYEKN